MITSSLSPTSLTISMMSSSAQGLASEFDPRPQARRAEGVFPRHLDEAFARGRPWHRPESRPRDCREMTSTSLMISPTRARTFSLCARHEVNHALEPHRQFAQRRGCAEGERAEEIARELIGEFRLRSERV